MNFDDAIQLLMGAQTARERDTLFRSMPREHWLDLGQHFENGEWCEFAVLNDPDLAWLNNPYKREQENYHTINSLISDFHERRGKESDFEWSGSEGSDRFVCKNFTIFIWPFMYWKNC